MRNRLFLVGVLAALVLGLTVTAGAVPRDEKKPVADHGVKALPIKASLVGEWLGLAETRNEHVTPESLKLKLFINADASVTGFVGAWKLADGVIRRTNARERQDYMSEFLVTGTAEGMKCTDGAQPKVIITVDFKGTAGEGTVRGFVEGKNGGKVSPHRWNITHLNLYPIK